MFCFVFTSHKKIELIHDAASRGPHGYLKKLIKGVRVHNLSLVLIWHRLIKVDFNFPGYWKQFEPNNVWYVHGPAYTGLESIGKNFHPWSCVQCLFSVLNIFNQYHCKTLSLNFFVPFNLKFYSSIQGEGARIYRHMARIFLIIAFTYSQHIFC